MNTARFSVMIAFNFISHIWTNPVNIIRVMRYNTIVFRRTSSNIQIKDGSTIAAYVAFTQKPFRTKVLRRSQKFPMTIMLSNYWWGWAWYHESSEPRSELEDMNSTWQGKYLPYIFYLSRQLQTLLYIHWMFSTDQFFL